MRTEERQWKRGMDTYLIMVGQDPKISVGRHTVTITRLGSKDKNLTRSGYRILYANPLPNSYLYFLVFLYCIVIEYRYRKSIAN